MTTLKGTPAGLKIKHSLSISMWQRFPYMSPSPTSMPQKGMMVLKILKRISILNHTFLVKQISFNYQNYGIRKKKMQNEIREKCVVAKGA